MSESVKRHELSIRTLELLNKSDKKIDTIRELLLLFKEFTGFEAVGIRLNEGKDYPYYETNGFEESFVKAERYLCAKDKSGEIICDADGNPVLECMCGNIIKGRFDPSLDFFTTNGSFWSNCTTELLASTTEEERQARTRNRCNGEGYESVGLVPLQADNEVIGLMQFNDRRKDMFTLDLVNFLENIGYSIGIALRRKQIEEELERHRKNLEDLVDEQTKELRQEKERAELYLDILGHDINNQNQSIITLLGLTLEEHQLNDEVRENVQLSLTQAKTISNLVHNVKELSRIQGDIPKIVNVNSGMVLKNAINQVRLQYPGKYITISNSVPESGVRVKANALLEDVFQNIISNAVKFNLNKTIEIEIDYSSLDDDNLWKFEFKDNGMGVPDKIKEAIFTRLHKTDDSVPGSGLGLAIVEGVVSVYGGKVWVENRVKDDHTKGSNFIVTVPRGE